MNNTMYFFIITTLLFTAFPAYAGIIIRPSLTQGLFASSNNTLRNGLVGHWTFDGKDISGTTFLDRSEFGNNGTKLASGTALAIGRIGQGLTPDGVTGYVNVGRANSLNFNNRNSKFSFGGWAIAKVSSLNNQLIVGKWGATNQQYGINYGGSGNNAPNISVVLQLSTSGASAQVNMNSSKTYPVRVWHHIIGTVDIESGQFKIYVDGIQDSENNNKTLGTLFNSSANVTIGAASISGNPTPLNGSVDDIRIYNRILSPSEIKRLYAQGTPGINASLNTLRNGLVGYWTFNGKNLSGTTAFDSAGNNNGTLTNKPQPVIGRIGQALNFDGTDDFVNGGSGASLDNLATVTKGLTVSAWIKPLTLGDSSAGVIVDKGTASSVGWRLRVAVNNALNFDAQFDTTDLFRTSANNSIKLGEWQHVAATWDGSSLARNVFLFINGNFQAGGSIGNGVTTRPDDSAQNINFGGTGITLSFNGGLDEIRVYDRVLSPDEIKRLYNMGK